MQRRLDWLNSLPATEAEAELLKCCGSSEWARLLVKRRDFDDSADLLNKANAVWWTLGPDDWLEAFRSHPRIGERLPGVANDRSRKWSEQEQAGVGDAPHETLSALENLNGRYEEKFGFIFIVCATGKSSAEMLSLLSERLENDRETELRNAAAEQAKITQLRLGKLLNQ